jgi:hypothetical protein
MIRNGGVPTLTMLVLGYVFSVQSVLDGLDPVCAIAGAVMFVSARAFAYLGKI